MSGYCGIPDDETCGKYHAHAKTKAVMDDRERNECKCWCHDEPEGCWSVETRVREARARAFEEVAKVTEAFGSYALTDQIRALAARERGTK